MPPKRKATIPNDSAEPSPKRITRSAGPLIDTQPQTRSSPRTSATVKSLITYGRKKPQEATGGRSLGRHRSLKENDTKDLGLEEPDELNLSPSRRLSASRPVTPTRTAAPRLIMHSVEITTPSQRLNAFPGREICSPAPSPSRRSRTELELSGRKHDTFASHTVSQASAAILTPEHTPSRSSRKQPRLKVSSHPTPGDPLALPTPEPTPSKRSRMKPVTEASMDNTNSFHTDTGGVSVVLEHDSQEAHAHQHTSPRKAAAVSGPKQKLPEVLPSHLHSCLNAQKRAILRALQNPLEADAQQEDIESDDPSTNQVAFEQLNDLLNGTVSRNEGNSCLLLGPRGSGKTRLVERCINSLPHRPIIIRLSGWAQQTDRLAMREIAWQLTQQTGTSFLSRSEENDEDDEDENPFEHTNANAVLPPSSHLPALISVLPTLSRPTIVILDAFDLFVLHPRQSLLYCLLDTAQSCRADQGHKGIAMVGVTSRVDTLNLFEKRVKSRFSGRILRTAQPSRQDWMSIAKNALSTPISPPNPEWQSIWDIAMTTFLADQSVMNTLIETFSLIGDVRMLSRLMTPVIVELIPSSPYPTSSQLLAAADSQRCRSLFPSLHALPYPSICLLIAAMHAQTAARDVITFEMLHEYFRDQVRASTSAPVQVDGGSIGMMRCSREVLMSAFEHLVSVKYFVDTASPSSTAAKQFVRYRCAVDREALKSAVEKMGKTNLKKWLSKAQ